MPSFDRLDDALSDRDLHGYFIDAAADDSDQRYLSGFDAPDPYFTLYTPDDLVLLVSELEYGRARKTSAATTINRYADYDYSALREEHGPLRAREELAVRFLHDTGANSVLVPARFPLHTADGLRANGIDVTPDTTDVVKHIRAVKTPDELDLIRTVQTANERAMAAAEDLLTQARIHDDTLHHDGEPLTSERVKTRIEQVLLEHGCGLDETIVAGGTHAADPHDRGSGPLPAHEPIVIDIFPRDKTTKYHADMTRTVVRGTPTPEVQARFDLTLSALETATNMIEPGVTGAAVHAAVCDIYEDAGHPTLRKNPTAETGFIHNTGHGVGLDIHELPLLAPAGPELEPGHVVTVEPGLYDPAVGGMRLEDLVVVTDTGHENLTQHPKHLTLS